MRGSALIEILCAMTIAIIVFAGVLQASFGESALLLGTGQARDLSYRARAGLDRAASLAHADFNLLYGTSSLGMITVDTQVQLMSDLVTKRASVRAWRTSEPGLYAEYTTLISNLDNIEAPDTCDASMHGDWTHPQRIDYPIRTLIGTTTGTYTIGDIDAFMHRLYVGLEVRSLKTDPTILALDISAPQNPVLIGMAATASTTAGISALRAARKGGRTRIFAAASGNFAKGQLQILDMTDPAHIPYPLTYKVPPVHAPTAGNGRSLSYRSGFIYLGLTAAPGVSEFAIIDVHDPAVPTWVGGYHIGNSVESIVAKDDRAYLATDDNAREFLMMDVVDPSSPHISASYDAPGSVGSGYGRSLFIRGDRAYFGRTWVLNGGVPEYQVLDLEGPGVSLVASRDVGTSPHPYGIYGSLVRSDMAFLLTKAGTGGQLLVLAIGDEAHIGTATPIATVDLPASAGGVALDCEENVLYVASNDPSGAGIISIITP